MVIIIIIIITIIIMTLITHKNNNNINNNLGRSGRVDAGVAVVSAGEAERRRRDVVQSADERLVETGECGRRYHGDDGAASESSRADGPALQRATHGDVALEREGDDQPHGHEAERVRGVQEGATHARRVDPGQPAVRGRPARKTIV